ncbi:MAG: hypothetical protein JSW47_06950 [Phycisphaerales bacterium]|nr:MAG: hypothetical protein JSW47_06950 [Phycisphaerales bacterium]
MLDRYREDCRISQPKAALILVLILATRTCVIGGNELSAYTRIWDTGQPLGEKVDVTSRTGWKLVPCNLLSLESNPAAAASDPGYYGCEYPFKADAVVENEHLTAVFRSKADSVAVYSKADGSRKIFELAPVRMGRALTEIGRIDRCSLIRNNGNDAALEVFYSGADDSSIVFVFDETEIVEVRPGAKVEGVRIFSSIRYGVVPDFIGDDLIFDPGQYPSMEGLSIPFENMFLGLLEGRDCMMVITWPQGRQMVGLTLGSGQAGRRMIKSFNFLNFANDGRSLYLAVLSAAGIWHEEQLKPSYLEKDVAIGWKRPFPAKWTTQLLEAGVRTTFTFKESKEKIWRGVAGHYTYPVWFDGDNAFFRLSKKIPPGGRSVIYCLEGKETPALITTPVDILKQTLGRQACESILDFPGRVLRTHHRRGAEGIHRACTCGCTEAIEAVFKAGQEVQRKAYVSGAVDDMLFFVRRHIERIDEYRAFAKDMMEYLVARGKSAPNLKPYLDDVLAIVEQIPQEYERNKENMKTLEYAIALARKTKALTAKRAAGNLPAYQELSKKWRAMGGAQDNVIGAYHSITRKIAQQAGYGCADQPGAVEVAQEIRRRCRQCLRRADGYEIWPDY